MAMMLRLCAILGTVAQTFALQWSPSVLFASRPALNVSELNADEGECRVPEGRLLFLHIMKAGGTSVDAFLACHCKRVGCSLQMSLGPYHDLHGNKNCEHASICTTHGDYRNRKELCGDKFAHPQRVFSVFREPVSRVFSLYNYEKEQSWSLPPIAEVYQQCENEVLDASTPIGWLCEGMRNYMTLKTFAIKDNRQNVSWDTALLEQAKTVVGSLDATFFLDDFGQFAEAFRQSKLITNEYVKPFAQRCELGHSNPTECPSCASEPTAEEVELITKHNQMDIQLYKYAAKLPNRWTA